MCVRIVLISLSILKEKKIEITAIQLTINAKHLIIICLCVCVCARVCLQRQEVSSFCMDISDFKEGYHPRTNIGSMSIK
jgi:hypothetical protein